MLELEVLTGGRAGLRIAAKEFPFGIGRDSTDGLLLEDPGIWNKHAVISLEKDGFFKLNVDSRAPALHESTPFTERILQNGDVIQLGFAKILFCLGKADQHRFAFREWFTWAIPALISLAQVALIYALQNG